MGDTTQELSLWDRPEDMNHTRPSFSVSPSAPGADVMAHTAAALAAASAVFQRRDAVYARQLLDAAQSLYHLAAANEGLSSQSITANATVSLLLPLVADAVGLPWKNSATASSSYSTTLCFLNICRHFRSSLFLIAQVVPGSLLM